MAYIDMNTNTPNTEPDMPVKDGLGMVRVRVNLNDLTWDISFSNRKVIEALSKDELQQIVNPLFWKSFRIMLLQSLEQSKLVTATAATLQQLPKIKPQ